MNAIIHTKNTGSSERHAGLSAEQSGRRVRPETIRGVLAWPAEKESEERA